MFKELYKTDKNGTKYYHCTDKCLRCGGRGIIEVYIPINGGECFECYGSGIAQWDDKEYTAEYAEKLEKRRQAREEKRIAKMREELPEKQNKWLEKNGIGADKVTYLFLGNTYEIKDELKAIGAKFDYILGWHISHEVSEYPTVAFDVSAYMVESLTDGYYWSELHTVDIEAVKRSAVGATSDYIGQTGDKISVHAKVENIASYDTQFGTTMIYIFADDNGNKMVWKTSTWQDIDRDDTLTLKGTVKDHSEYRGEKQTVLTRCKIEKDI